MTTAWLLKIASPIDFQGGHWAKSSAAVLRNHVSFICCFAQNEIKMFASPQHEVC